jgi:rhodanese-related sulfurtransferase
MVRAHRAGAVCGERVRKTHGSGLPHVARPGARPLASAVARRHLMEVTSVSSNVSLLERWYPMKHLSPEEAFKYMQEHPDAVMVDCRSEMEYLFVGHPVGAHHVAWNELPDWEVNPHFVGQVKKISSIHRPVVLICRSGNRSVEAGHALEAAGFSDIYNVTDGFEGPLDDDHHRGSTSGWRQAGLPWEQC